MHLSIHMMSVWAARTLHLVYHNSFLLLTYKWPVMKVIVWSFTDADSAYVSMGPVVQPIEQISLGQLVLLIVTLHGCNDITLWIGKTVFKHLILNSVMRWSR